MSVKVDPPDFGPASLREWGKQIAEAINQNADDATTQAFHARAKSNPTSGDGSDGDQGGGDGGGGGPLTVDYDDSEFEVDGVDKITFRIPAGEDLETGLNEVVQAGDEEGEAVVIMGVSQQFAIAVAGVPKTIKLLADPTNNNGQPEDL